MTEPLTPDEIEQAAARLCRTAYGVSFTELPENQKTGYRMVVERTWDAMMKGADKNPTAVRVFMVWMGDDQVN